jgi:hypothetical protein
MAVNLTLNLWNFALPEPNVVIAGQLINIWGTQCYFLGVAPDKSAYFWVCPGDARALHNSDLEQLGLAVISYMDIKAELKRLRGNK